MNLTRNLTRNLTINLTKLEWVTRPGLYPTHSRVGYSFIVRGTRGTTSEITPHQGIKEQYLAHTINHTCPPDFQNGNFLNTVVTKNPRGVGQKMKGV